MRHACLMLAALLLAPSAAAAQSGSPETASSAALAPDFYGKIIYFGNHSGEVVQTQPGAPRRTGGQCPKPGTTCPERIGGSFQVELEFEGEIVRGRYQGTGGMRPSRLIGRRSGGTCRLFDIGDGSVWTARCDNQGFAGTARSVENAAEQLRLSFETVGVRVIDLAGVQRQRELAALYTQYAATAFGTGPIAQRLDALLVLDSYDAPQGTGYTQGTLGEVRISDRDNGGRDYTAYAPFTRDDGQSGWVRATVRGDVVTCIETSAKQGQCRVIDREPPEPPIIPGDDFLTPIAPAARS